MHLAAKIFDFFLDPANIVGVLTVLGAVMLASERTRRGAGRMLVLAASISLAGWFLPIDAWLLRPLEQRFQPGPIPARVDGIFMVGGAQRPRVTRAYGRPALNEHAERMTEFVALARRFPAAKLVFAGGSGVALGEAVGESETVRLFIVQQGIDPARMIYETRSRNTWENIVFAEKMVQPRQGETWLFVTSAADMPRAMGVFRRVGWPVVPVPVAFQTTREIGWPWPPAASLQSQFGRIFYGLHEWAGLIAYYVLGRNEQLLPGP